jgi:hypothetical protein
MRRHPSGRPIHRRRTVAAPQPRAPRIGLIPHLKRRPKPKRARDQSGNELAECIGFLKFEVPENDYDDGDWV